MFKMHIVISTIVFSFLIASAAFGTAESDDLFHHQRRFGQRGQSRRSGGSRQAVPDTGGGGRRRQPDLAGLPEHAGSETRSTHATASARDRGSTRKGVQVAANVAELHSAKNNITPDTAAYRKGRVAKPGTTC